MDIKVIIRASFGEGENRIVIPVGKYKVEDVKQEADHLYVDFGNGTYLTLIQGAIEILD